MEALLGLHSVSGGQRRRAATSGTVMMQTVQPMGGGFILGGKEMS